MHPTLARVRRSRGSLRPWAPPPSIEMGVLALKGGMILFRPLLARADEVIE